MLSQVDLPSVTDPDTPLERSLAAQRLSDAGSSLLGLAEGVGFEPTLRFHVNTLSKRAP